MPFPAIQQPAPVPPQVQPPPRPPQTGFDVEKARNDGYNDDEILEHLTSSRKFNVQKALQDGYSKQELISHLATTPSSSIDYNKTPEPSNLQKLGTGVVEGLAGIGARAVAAPLVGGYNLLRKYGPTREPNLPEVSAGKGRQPLLPEPSPFIQSLPEAPESIPGQVGGAVGEFGPYLIPGTAVAKGAGLVTKAAQAVKLGPKAVKVATALGRAGLDAAGMAGVHAVQSGGADPEGSKQMGKVAGGLSLAGSALGAAIPVAAAAYAKKFPKGNAFVVRLQQALRPQHPGFEEAAMRAGPEIKKSETELNTIIGNGIDPLTNAPSPNQAIQDLLENTRHSKQRVWKEYEQVRGVLEHTLHDTSPVADSIIQAIPETLRQQNPEAVAALVAKANTFRKELPIQTIEKMLGEANGEVAVYEAKYPAMKRAALASNPETAEAVARANGLRKVLYGAYEDPAEGAIAREFKKRYGALTEVELAAERAKIIADRQAPLNLNQQFSVADTGRRMVRSAAIGGMAGLPHGRPIEGALLGAGEGLAEGTAGVALAKWARDHNSTNNLIKKAFSKFEGLPAAPDAGPGPSAGKLLELEAGPRAPKQGPVPKRGAGGGIEAEPIPDPSFVKGVTAQSAIVDPAVAASKMPRQLPAPETPPVGLPPAPDTSFVKGVPASYGTPVPGKPRIMIEAPPTPMPAAPDPSGVTRVAPAARQVGRDPATGKMKRFYTSQPSFPTEHLEEFAQKNNLSTAEAKKLLEEEGWQVGGPSTQTSVAVPGSGLVGMGAPPEKAVEAKPVKYPVVKKPGERGSVPIGSNEPTNLPAKQTPLSEGSKPKIIRDGKGEKISISKLEQFAKDNNIGPMEARQILSRNGFEVEVDKSTIEVGSTEPPDIAKMRKFQETLDKKHRARVTSPPGTKPLEMPKPATGEWSAPQGVKPQVRNVEEFEEHMADQYGSDWRTKLRIGKSGPSEYTVFKRWQLEGAPEGNAPKTPLNYEEWSTSAPPESPQPRNKGKFGSKYSSKSKPAQAASRMANDASDAATREENRIKKLSSAASQDYLQLREVASKAAKAHRGAIAANKAWHADMPKDFQSNRPLEQAAYHEKEAQKFEELARAPSKSQTFSGPKPPEGGIATKGPVPPAVQEAPKKPNLTTTSYKLPEGKQYWGIHPAKGFASGEPQQNLADHGEWFHELGWDDVNYDKTYRGTYQIRAKAKTVNIHPAIGELKKSKMDEVKAGIVRQYPKTKHFSFEFEKPYLVEDTESY